MLFLHFHFHFPQISYFLDWDLSRLAGSADVIDMMECFSSLKDNEFTPKFALNIVLRHSGKHSIFLGIDEITKCGLPTNMVTTLGSLLFCLPPNEFLFYMLTTLEAVNLHTISTSSGRKINWVTLPSLPLQHPNLVFKV